MKLPKEPNWASIIERLQKRGLTQTAIEKLTGIKQDRISRLKRGDYKHVSYVVGKAIMGLYKRVKK